MPLRRVPVGRLAALIAVIVGVWVLAQSGGGPGWRTLGPGLEFSTLRGDRWCRRGSGEVAVLRLDPALVPLRVRHYLLEPDRRPLGIVEWHQRSGARAVFNAGQYYPDLSYMGLLVSDGRVVSSRRHPGFQAVLVASGGARPRAHVLDLARDSLAGPRGGWSQIAQSFMLFDAAGGVRVRRSDKVANRTAVGEDEDGRIVVAVTEGGYTISDFAEMLRRSPLGLTHAMSMDGGLEAQLCVESGDFRYATFGPWKKGEASEAPGATVTLPAVISVGTR